LKNEEKKRFIIIKETERVAGINNQNKASAINDIDINPLSMSHIIVKNPILKADTNTKDHYMKLLKKYLEVGQWDRKEYVKEQLNAYVELINNGNKENLHQNLDYYKYYILCDFLQILGFLGFNNKIIHSRRMKEVLNQYIADFPDMSNKKIILNKFLNMINEDINKWETLVNQLFPNEEKEYAKLLSNNLQFKNKAPLTFTITATMSAGKSTFINALTGNYISLSQNMACTSKIHTIISKAFDDGCLYKYDDYLVLVANKDELLSDNRLNSSDKIIASVYYNGDLGGERIIINDSPGVNFSGDAEHRKITERLIKSKNFDVLIYLMNSTQLATNDEDEHLEFIRNNIGETPILFIINKIDAFNIEEENITKTISNLISYIESKGFQNPIVCPISSKAGYMSKNYKRLLKIEKRELYSYIDKFENMRLPDYYNEYFPSIKIEDKEIEETQLLKNCGLAYVERIIKLISRGGRVNDSSIY